MPNFNAMPIVQAMKSLKDWDALKAFEAHVNRMQIAPSQRNHVLREATRHFMINCPDF